ncbi:MAG TPA: hypothetical protein VHE30_10690 [Polyangiaceae bacterium]|nr:hypothetical protein [Polyangiaceae bacterium]
MIRSPSVEPSDTCLEVSEIRSRGGALSEAARAHAETCPICRAGAEAPSGEGLDLFDGVLAEVQAERGLTATLRSLPTGLRLGVAALFVVLAAGVVIVAAPRWHHAEVPVARVALVVSVLLSLLAVALRLALRPLQAPAPAPSVGMLGFLLGALAPVVFALLPVGGPAVSEPPGVSPGRAIAWCFGAGAIVGGLAVALLRALDRGAHGSSGAALLAATAGGLVANTVLELHCAITDRTHLLLAHAGVALAIVLVYGILFRPRPR